MGLTFCANKTMGGRFDMSRHASDEVSGAIRTIHVDCDQSKSSILHEIETILQEVEAVSEKEAGSVARIALQSFGSSSWLCMRGIDDGASDLHFLEMLHTIKGLVRGRRASVLLTVPGWFLDCGAIRGRAGARPAAA